MRPFTVLEQAADVAGLAGVLDVVVAVLTRRTPSVTGGSQRSSTTRSRSVDVSRGQQARCARGRRGSSRAGPRSQGGWWRPGPRCARSRCSRVGADTEARRPVARGPQLILTEQLGDVVVLDRGEVPDGPADRFAPGAGRACNSSASRPSTAARTWSGMRPNNSASSSLISMAPPGDVPADDILSQVLVAPRETGLAVPARRPVPAETDQVPGRTAASRSARGSPAVRRAP